jgi:hypothetical protein
MIHTNGFIMFRTKLDKKSNKNCWPKPSHERQKGRPKKRPMDAQPARMKDGRELVLFIVEAISPIAFLMSQCKS